MEQTSSYRERETMEETIPWKKLYLGHGLPITHNSVSEKLQIVSKLRRESDNANH